MQPSKALYSMSMPSAHPEVRTFALRCLYLVIAALCVSAVATSCVTEEDLTADQRVHQLSQQLMCPVCDGQTLDQSQAQLSEDMKTVIRVKIEDGETNAEIREYFVERYGEIVLASPEAGGFNLIAWVVPGVIFLGGALLVGNAYLNMKRRRHGVPVVTSQRSDEATFPASPTDVELDEYLQRADREMASVLGGSSENPLSDGDTEDKA